jgi:hypothetical protein
MAKCRICTNELTKKNRSILKGVCQQDYKHLTPDSFYNLTVPVDQASRTWLRGMSDVREELTPEQYEREMAWRMNPGGEQEPKIEVELTKQEVRELAKIRARKVRGRAIAGPSNHPRLPRAVPQIRTMVEVELTEEEKKMLEELRAKRNFPREMFR